MFEWHFFQQENIFTRHIFTRLVHKTYFHNMEQFDFVSSFLMLNVWLYFCSKKHYSFLCYIFAEKILIFFSTASRFCLNSFKEDSRFEIFSSFCLSLLLKFCVPKCARSWLFSATFWVAFSTFHFLLWKTCFELLIVCYMHPVQNFAQLNFQMIFLRTKSKPQTKMINQNFLMIQSQGWENSFHFLPILNLLLFLAEQITHPNIAFFPLIFWHILNFIFHRHKLCC